METTVYGEIVQIKQDRMIPVFRCTVIETLVAQYCGMFSAAGVTRYLKFRELKPLEAWECRKARRSGRLLINGRSVEGKIGATVSHTMFLAGDLDDDSNCEVGTVTLRDGKVLGGIASQGLYEITLREEFARMNELTGSLTLTSGVQARAADKSIADSLEGTVVWEYDPMECPQTIVRLYKGMMKAYVNQTSTYRGLRLWSSIRTRTRLPGWSWPSPSFCAATRPSGPTSKTSPSSCTRMTGWRWLRAASPARKARWTSPG